MPFSTPSERSPTDNGSDNVFATRPIRLDGFTLHALWAEPTERPTLTEWQSAFRLASSSQESSPYWVGDLLAYADTRQDWRAKLDQAKAVTGLSHQTLLNQASISRCVPEPVRKLAPSYSHAAAVARLDSVTQACVLTEAKARGWTVAELRRAVRRAARETVPETSGTHTVDVTVRVTLDAPSSWEAQEAAWQAIKAAIVSVSHAHVISAVALNPEPVGA